MITHDNVVNFLRQSLTTYLESPYDDNTGQPLGKNKDLIENMDIFEEGSYNSNKDIIITIQFLKGTTQQGVTDMPINVIFEVNDGKATKDVTIATLFMDLMNSFIEDYNDTTTTMRDDNNTTYVAKQYYSSTNVMGNGQQRGVNKYRVFSMDMRLIVYETGYFQSLEDSKIKFNLGVGNTQVLENLLEVTTQITKTQESFTTGNNPKQNTRIIGIQYQIQVTYIATKTNTLHVKLANEALNNTFYNITHEGFVNRTADMKVTDYTESTPYADVMKVRLTLVRK